MPGLFSSGNDQPGANGAPVDVPITAKAPAWAANMHDTMSPAGAPGQIQGLANNLAAGGFGASAPDFKRWMESFYRPAPTSYYAPPKPVVKPVVKPKVPVVPPVGPTSDPRFREYGTRRDGDKTIYERLSGHR